MKSYKIAVWDKPNKRFISRTVQGYAVNDSLFVYHDTGPFGKRWTVTDIDTGAMIAPGTSRTSAITNALARLESVGAEKCQQVKAGILAKYGKVADMPEEIVTRL